MDPSWIKQASHQMSPNRSLPCPRSYLVLRGHYHRSIQTPAHRLKLPQVVRQVWKFIRLPLRSTSVRKFLSTHFDRFSVVLKRRDEGWLVPVDGVAVSLVAKLSVGVGWAWLLWAQMPPPARTKCRAVRCGYTSLVAKPSCGLLGPHEGLNKAIFYLTKGVLYDKGVKTCSTLDAAYCLVDSLRLQDVPELRSCPGVKVTDLAFFQRLVIQC